MPSGPPAERGLSAPELALVAAELAAALLHGEVLDAVPLTHGDDLLLVVEHGGSRHFLHVALGSARARIALTSRRFRRDEQRTGPRTDALKQRLAGARLQAVEQPAGERRVTFVLGRGDERLLLQVELFSARGLWALCAEDGTVLELSRPVETKVRTLRPGDRYQPPPPRAPAAMDAPAGSAAPRFTPPVLAAVDAHYSALDRTREAEDAHRLLQLAASRAATRAGAKVDGLRRQLQASEQAVDLRAEADLMLAYLHTTRRGQASMTVPWPDGTDRVVALDPSRSVQAQAQARYERARRLEDGRPIAQQRLQQAEDLAAELQTLADSLQSAPDGESPPAADLDAVRARLQQLGELPRPKPAAPSRPARKDRTAGENLRRFTSAEGLQILVGRDNRQNDRLSMRIANGNDVWMHVGGGRAGSHVVIRLPKGRTASLDTLLDAGTLAVHFSKARGERLIEVVYTLAKNVRKPKGLPAGAVVPQHTKTLRIRLEDDRLQRLLNSAADDSGS